MNLNSLVTQAHQSFSKFWTARDARERSMLAAAAMVTMLGLTYAVLISPALNGRQQLSKSLPQLRQQAAQLQAMSREVATLAGKSALPVPTVSKESVEAALAQKGLKPQSVTLTGDLARVQLAGVSFASTLEWLVEMQKTAMLSVVEANIVALAQADAVDATLTLRQQRIE